MLGHRIVYRLRTQINSQQFFRQFFQFDPCNRTPLLVHHHQIFANSSHYCIRIHRFYVANNFSPPYRLVRPLWASEQRPSHDPIASKCVSHGNRPLGNSIDPSGIAVGSFSIPIQNSGQSKSELLCAMTAKKNKRTKSQISIQSLVRSLKYPSIQFTNSS